MAELHLKSLEKTYGNGYKAVHGIDLEVREGEFMVLVGPSGCAKSTTLRVIAGLETITGGAVQIGDRVVNDLVPGKRGIAMVFQNYALYPHMKVRRNLSFGLKLRREPAARIERATSDVSGILEIEELLDRLPKQLSGGQAQRVALGRALIKQPEVFLFDEPLSNLDAKLRGTMRAELAALRQRLTKNMIYVTHDQIEAMTLGDRIVVMLDGHIQQAGTPEELYRSPVNRFVAGFIGSPPMNFAEGTVAGANAVRLGAATLHLPAAAPGMAPGRSVHVGIRPNRLRPAREADANRIDGTVRLSEYVGASSVLHMDSAIGPVTVEWDSEAKVAIGETLPLGVDPDDIYLFDARTGETITGGMPGEMGSTRHQDRAA